MRTTIDIDESLFGECVQLTGLKTKREVINLALRELSSRKKRQKILDYEGKFDWDGNIRKMRRDRI